MLATLQNKKNILKIARKYRAHNIRVFGSVSRGEDSNNSDVDLLVSFKKGASLLDQAGLMDELESLLHTKVDVVSDRSINQCIRDKVLKDAQPL